VKTNEREILSNSMIFNVFHRYFSQIDVVLLNEILEIYQFDFDLFNYDSSKYFKLVQNPKKFNGVDNRLDLNDVKTTSKRDKSATFS
jgi:hypothetical protein